MTAAVLSVRKVGKRFGAQVALEGVDLDLSPGEIHAVCGENGAGKSTLMRILCGALSDYDGELFLDGVQRSFAGVADAQRAGVAIVHQELPLCTHLSVAENVFLGRESALGGFWLRRGAMRRRTRAILDKLGVDLDPDARVDALRVGDRQIAALAKALAFDARVAIFDEPTSALSPAETARLFRIVGDLRSAGVAVAYISHKMDEVFRWADRITVLRDGKKIGTTPRSETTPDAVIRMMVGRAFDAQTRAPAQPVGTPVLEVSNLSHRGARAGVRLREVNLKVSAGEIVGVAGLMGAGRTELLETLCGADATATAGAVRFQGQPASWRDPHGAWTAGVAYLTEDRKQRGLLVGRSVRENLALSWLGTRRDWLPIPRRKERRTAQRTADRLQVKAASLAQRIERLSGGNQQKCLLARCLLAAPKLLLLDEPTRGVDVGAKAEIYRLLRGLADDGLAVLMTSSELPELLAVCDRIVVLCAGRINGEFAAAEATEEKLLRAMIAAK